MSAKKKLSADKRKQFRAYAAAANEYCRAVVAGEIRACKWVRLACARHLADLARSRTEEFKYKFDPIRAGKACGFIERFPHVKGHWAQNAERIRLGLWQCFIVCSIFGWVDKVSGLRRFRQAVLLVPRKNGKTVLAAGIGLYMFVGDGEPGAEVYTGAGNKKQAKEVFSPASKMAKRAEGFKDWFGIEINLESMQLPDEGSKFEIVIGTPGDGPSPHCFLHDEFHEQPTWAQYDTARTGMGARRQPLQLVISTAGIDIEGPCFTLQEDLKKVLDGTFINDRLFGVVYTVDDPDRLVETPGGQLPYWATIEAAQEVNPNYGVSVLADYIEAELKEAIQRPARQNAYKCKNLNIWTNARNPWMNMIAWKACADHSLSMEEFLQYRCFQGLDLGARIDLTSRCRLFVKWQGDQRHYYAFGTHYVPRDRANDGEHQHYERWIKEHRIVDHEGAEIQLAFVQKEIEAELPQFSDVVLAFDQHQAMQMQQELRLRLGDAKVLDVPQTWKYLDPAMKEIEAAVLSGRFHYDGDPVLTWAVGNVFVKPDANENIFPRKEDRPNIKIDPASALFNAMYLALSAGPQQSPNEMFFV